MRNDAICPTCERDRPHFVIDEHGKCDYCRAEYDRARWAVINSLSQLNEGWSSAKGDEVRAHRNMLLTQSHWAVMPGSELSDDCQLAFAEYFRKLNRITVDYEKPADVVWPEIPALEYRQPTT